MQDNEGSESLGRLTLLLGVVQKKSVGGSWVGQWTMDKAAAATLK